VVARYNRGNSSGYPTFSQGDAMATGSTFYPNDTSCLDELIRAHDNLDLNHPSALPAKAAAQKLEHLVTILRNFFCSKLRMFVRS
jgi:hypothetical protein